MTRRKETPEITKHDLEALVASLGVSLTEHQGGPKGYYHHPSRTISLRAGLSERAYLSTLAHELVHAAYRDEPTGIPHLDERMERRANRLAAQLLINPVEYAAAEALHGPHDDMIAHELGVTKKLLATWRNHYQRKAA